MAANEAGIQVTIGGRRYWFDPSKYFATESSVTNSSLAPDDERLQHLVRALTGQQGEPSGAESEV